MVLEIEEETYDRNMKSGDDEFEFWMERKNEIFKYLKLSNIATKYGKNFQSHAINLKQGCMYN